jgi:hypothetical protein
MAALMIAFRAEKASGENARRQLAKSLAAD